MSENYIHVIPENPGFVPAKDRQEKAVSYFRKIAPEADEVSISVTDDLVFIHCGGNFEETRCPFCKAVLELEFWQRWMNDDFAENGFRLSPRKMPCCGARYTLHELAYDWPQGFARCDIRAMNPRIGRLSSEDQQRFEAILDCPVRVIYEHI